MKRPSPASLVLLQIVLSFRFVTFPGSVNVNDFRDLVLCWGWYGMVPSRAADSTMCKLRSMVVSYGKLVQQYYYSYTVASLTRPVFLPLDGTRSPMTFSQRTSCESLSATIAVLCGVRRNEEKISTDERLFISSHLLSTRRTLRHPLLCFRRRHFSIALLETFRGQAAPSLVILLLVPES